MQGNQLFGPYGNGRYYAGNLTTSKGFTGQYNDGLTGLDYFNARYYDPVAGVFLSPDSVQGNTSGLNPYGYVGGNPETATDPSGHAYDWEQGGAGGGGDGGDGAGAGIGGEDNTFGDASTSAIESTGNGFEPAIKVDWTTPTEQVWEENGQTYVTNFDANGHGISINPIDAPDNLEAVDHGFVNSGVTPQDRVEEPNGPEPLNPEAKPTRPIPQPDSPEVQQVANAAQAARTGNKGAKVGAAVNIVGPDGNFLNNVNGGPGVVDIGGIPAFHRPFAEGGFNGKCAETNLCVDIMNAIGQGIELSEDNPLIMVVDHRNFLGPCQDCLNNVKIVENLLQRDIFLFFRNAAGDIIGPVDK